MITDKMERQQSPIYGRIKFLFDFSCGNNFVSETDRKIYELLYSILVDLSGCSIQEVVKSL